MRELALQVGGFCYQFLCDAVAMYAFFILASCLLWALGSAIEIMINFFKEIGNAFDELEVKFAEPVLVGTGNHSPEIKLPIWRCLACEKCHPMEVDSKRKERRLRSKPKVLNHHDQHNNCFKADIPYNLFEAAMARFEDKDVRQSNEVFITSDLVRQYWRIQQFRRPFTDDEYYHLILKLTQCFILAKAAYVVQSGIGNTGMYWKLRMLGYFARWSPLVEDVEKVNRDLYRSIDLETSMYKVLGVLHSVDSTIFDVVDYSYGRATPESPIYKHLFTSVHMFIVLRGTPFYYDDMTLHIQQFTRDTRMVRYMRHAFEDPLSFFPVCLMNSNVTQKSHDQMMRQEAVQEKRRGYRHWQNLCVQTAVNDFPIHWFKESVYDERLMDFEILDYFWFQDNIRSYRCAKKHFLSLKALTNYDEFPIWIFKESEFDVVLMRELFPWAFVEWRF